MPQKEGKDKTVTCHNVWGKGRLRRLLEKGGENSPSNEGKRNKEEREKGKGGLNGRGDV